MGDEIVLLVGTERTPKETLETICSGMGIKADIKEFPGTLWPWQVENGPCYAPEARQLHPSECQKDLELDGINVNQVVLFDISRRIDWDHQLEQVVFGTAALLMEESGDVLLRHNLVGTFVMRQQGKLYLNNDKGCLSVDLRALFSEPYVLINIDGR